jgi:hypothetical protein
MLIPQLAGKMFFPTLAEDGLTDEDHLQNSVSIFLDGLRPDS